METRHFVPCFNVCVNRICNAFNRAPTAAWRGSVGRNSGALQSWCRVAVLIGACFSVLPQSSAASLSGNQKESSSESKAAQAEQGASSRAGTRLDPLDLLGADSAGFDRVLGPRPLVFPDDHGPHRRFRTEWWYFTGNLADSSGREFGFQLTFFRFALPAASVIRASKWATNQIYLAHFALSDIAGGEFHTRERLSRGTLTLADAQARPFMVWIEDWSVQSNGDDLWPMRLQASDGGIGVALQLHPLKGLVLNGQEGYSRKGASPGNASHYYSYPRLAAQGEVQINQRRFVVTGLAWLDREWATSSLEPEQSGWDWFALQLDDGREVMFYRLRRRDGQQGQYDAGVLVGHEGQIRALSNEDVDIDATTMWESSDTGTRYPSSWRLRIPAEQIDLQVEPLLAGQEWQGLFRYWEGAVRVSGVAWDNPVSGRGYVELVGY